MPALASPHVARSVQLSRDVTLQYIERGTGIPVVCLHGVTDSWGSFEPMLAHVPESIRMIAPSLRGHGDSSRPASGYHSEDFADDVRNLLDVLDIGSAIIVGHSMGGLVALRTALRHPGRVRGLVLLDTTADWRGNTAIKELWDSPIGGMRDPVDPVFVREFQLSTIATQLPGSFIDAVVSESLKVPARIWRATFADFRQTSLVADLARIDAPTLIVWGDRDSICLRHDQDTLAAGIRDARFVVHPGAGHAAHWDAPDLVAADLVNFCHELSGRS